MKPPIAEQLCRVRAEVSGVVQGVGFRPHAYRLATSLGLAGWVRNSTGGLVLEVEGPRAAVEKFLGGLVSAAPVAATVDEIQSVWIASAGAEGFQIVESAADGRPRTAVLPDLATCAECRMEIFDPGNRRFRYPFTNCTQCGPRFSIIEQLPYDRRNTSMNKFTMCAECLAEYSDPGNRRFHAQPNACPVCGPRLELWDASGQCVGSADAALGAAAQCLRNGGILAVKGIGGFHLMADAGNSGAVARLRERKRRPDKPLALLFPSLEAVREICAVSAAEAELLQSRAAPIVLLEKRTDPTPLVCAAIAPGNPALGVMLPSNPLHHLLLTDLGFPVVATSGNPGDEPLCICEQKAIERLSGMADLFLVHNRPIVRHADDSIVRLALGRPMVLRRARGYAPLPLRCPEYAATGPVVLAVGAELKSSVALAVGDQVIVSQHIGDLGCPQSLEVFRGVIRELGGLYQASPALVAADLHPDYRSTAVAAGLSAGGEVTLVPVQHHAAHVLSCMADNRIGPPVLGVAWDGTGFGEDGTVWGGEFFAVGADALTRVAHLRTFALPGGEAAVREPRRAALGVLHEIFGSAALDRPLPGFDDGFSAGARCTLFSAIAQNVNSPRCSSAGRLFDAVAALLGLRQICSFEGQAAIELEALACRLGQGTDAVRVGRAVSPKPPPVPRLARRADAARLCQHGSGSAVDFPCSHQEVMKMGSAGATPTPNGPLSVQALDWAPAMLEVIDGLRQNLPRMEIAWNFHLAMARMILDVACRMGIEQIALSGGCFQNRLLLEQTVSLLRSAGFRPFWHRDVPPNDGGLALGQIVAARAYRS